MNVAELIADAIVALGVRHVFGVGGANIEDVFSAVQRRQPETQVVLNKHEHAAGTAADAYARLTGGVGVVLVTSGGGAMNLVHALAEAYASRVPLLAIVGEPPTELQGAGAFQDTSGKSGSVDAAAVFRGVTQFCARVEQAADAPGLLATALDAATELAGPAVLLIAKDRQRAEVPSGARSAIERPKPRSPAVDPELSRRAADLLHAGPTVVFAGSEVSRSGAREELVRLAERLDALVCVTPDARDAFPNDSARFLGVCGAMGTPRVARAVTAARTCLLAGTRLPLLARQGLEPLLAEKSLVSIGREAPFVMRERTFHVASCVAAGLRAINAELGAANVVDPPSLSPANALDTDGPLSVRLALAAVERRLPHDGIVLVDAGNTGAAAAHQLRLPSQARWLLAMGMAGMGYSFGAAVGAALATGKRCTVLAGDGAFFMNGLDVHTAVEHALPITYVVFDNRAHGMCLVRERLLLHENAGYNTFGSSHLGAGLGAMFPRLLAFDCRSVAELDAALERARGAPGPVFVSVELEEVEIPPFAALQAANTDGALSVPRGASHASD
jgi:acetolactate synthase-1/2/3 large subunit